jgi:hypothetical protein
MPDNNSIDWNDFFARQEKYHSEVSNQMREFEAARNNRPLSKEEILYNAFMGGKGSSQNKTVNLQNRYAGNNMTGPLPDKTSSLKTQIQNFNSVIGSDQFQPTDPFKLAKGFDFNGTQYGQFFDRYYHHPKFKKLGFSPFRDNETHYNKNSAWTDDFLRMSKMWPHLAWDGFTGLFQNWGNYSLNGDQYHAQQMEKYQAIAQSSRGGTGAFITNLTGNSGYTFGILAEIAAEELVLMGLGAIPGMQGLTVAGTGKNILRFGKLIKDIPGQIKRINSLKKITQSLQSVNAAKNFWNGANKFGKGTLNFLNPLEHTADFIKGYNAIDDLQKTSRGFGAFYRDLRSINAAWDEATLEGGMVQNETSTKLLNEYYKEHGYLPAAGSEDAEKIYATAQLAGRTTSALNIPAILYSNKIVFDKALRGTLINTHDLSSNLTKTIRKVATTGVGTEYHAFEKGIKATLKQATGKATRKDFWNSVPRSILNSTGNYLSANLTEGFQEVYQEGVAVGVKDYYERMYSNPMFGNNELVKHALYSGLQSQLSSQGLEVFLSGALMGTLVQGPQKLFFQGVPKGIENLRSSEKLFGQKGAARAKSLKEYKEARDKFADQVAESLTAAHNSPEKFFNLIYENAAEQRNLNQLYEDALLNNDIKKAKDITNTSLAFHLHTLISAGKLDIFRDKVKSMKDLSDTELEEAFGIQGQNGNEGKNIRSRVDKVLKQIETYKYSADKFDQKFGRNPYPKDSIGKIVFERAKRHFIYNAYSIEQTADRLSKLYNSIANNKSIGDLNANDIQLLLASEKDFTEHTKLSLSEIQLLLSEESTGEQKKEAGDKSRKLSAIAAIRKQLNDLTEIHTEISKLENSAEVDNAKMEELEEKASKAKEDIQKTFVNFARLSDPDGTSGTTDDAIEEVGNQIIDFYRLNNDKREFVATVNILSNPKYFTKYIETLGDTFKSIHANRKEFIKKSIKDFQNIEGKNKHVFNALFDKGVFLTPKGIDDLNEGRMPELYMVPADAGELHQKDVENGFEQLSPLSKSKAEQDKYYEALQIIRDYENESGITLTDKRLFTGKQATAGTEGIISRDQDDQRTTADFNEELGLNPDLREDTKSVTEVLAVLSNSLFLTYEMKELINALQLMVDPKDKITFVVDGALPIQYINNKGLQVDLRYFDAANNSNLPFERMMLKYLFMGPLNKAYQDTEFKGEIDELLNTVKEWFKKEKSEEETRILAELGYDQISPPELSSVEQFMSGALTNIRFQKLLQSIKSEKVERTKPTLFNRFLDFVKKVFSNIQNNLKSDTLLDEVVNTITQKVFEPVGVKPLLENDLDLIDIDEDMVIDSIEEGSLETLAPKLYKQLSTYIKKKNPDADVDTYLNKEYEDPAILNIIHEFIKQQEAELLRVAEIKGQIEKPTNEYTDYQLNYALLELGYTRNDLLAKNSDGQPLLTFEDKVNIKDNQIRKDEFAKRLEVAERELITNLGYTQEELSKMSPPAVIDLYIKEKINTINTDFKLTDEQEKTAADILVRLSEKKFGRFPIEEATETDVEAKKADIEKRRQGLNGVEEIIFSNPNFKLEGFEIDGNYWNVVTSTDRAKVLVNINGVIVPFYLTTGQAGKGLVPGWYPFFGIGKDGWLNKTDKSDMETYYERYWGKETANIVKSISEELNSFYGTNPSAFKNDGDPNATSRPLSTLADKVEDYINSKLSYTPAINNADARKTLRSNVEQLGKEINAKYDAELAALEGKTAQSTDTKSDVEAKKANIEVISENYTPELLRANADKLFIFGDNNTRTGKGGQAIIRDEPNAIGISTKLLPKNTPEAFMSDDDLANNKKVIDSDIKKVKERAAKEGKTIVLPKGGFGTGLAALATKAPQTFAYLNQRLQEEFGFNNTTGELAALGKEEVKTEKKETGKYAMYEIDENGNPVGEAWGRVSDLKPEYKGPKTTAAARGTHIDDLGRLFLAFDSKIDSLKEFKDVAKEELKKRRETKSENQEDYKTLDFTDAFYDSLYEEFKKIRDIAKENNWMLITDIPRMWGRLKGNRTGEIDILAIDPNGNLMLIDMKTASKSRVEDYYSKEKTSSNYKESDLIQLNAYIELFKQVTGRQIAEARILPITVKTEGAKVLNATIDKTKRVKPDIFRTLTLKVDTRKNIYELRPDIPNEIEEELQNIKNEEIRKEREAQRAKARRKNKRSGYQITKSIQARLDNETKGFIFFDNKGNQKTVTAQRLVSYSKILADWPDMVSSWWDILSAAEKNEALEMLKEISREEAHGVPALPTRRSFIIQALKSTKTGKTMKFSRESFTSDENAKKAGEITDAWLGKWTAKTGGTEIDTYAQELVEDYKLMGLSRYTDPLDIEAEIIEEIKEVIKDNPRGISNKTLQEAIDIENRSKLDVLLYDFADKYGLYGTTVKEIIEAKEGVEDIVNIPDGFYKEETIENEEEVEYNLVDTIEEASIVGIKSEDYRDNVQNSGVKVDDILDIVNTEPISWTRTTTGEQEHDPTPIKFLLNGKILGSAKFNSQNKYDIQKLIDEGREPKAVVIEVKRYKDQVSSIKYKIIAKSKKKDKVRKSLNDLYHEMEAPVYRERAQEKHRSLTSLIEEENLTLSRNYKTNEMPEDLANRVQQNVKVNKVDSVVGTTMEEHIETIKNIIDINCNG